MNAKMSFVSALQSLFFMGAFLGTFNLVGFKDPKLSYVPYKILHNDRNFSGIIFQKHQNGSLYKVIFSWNGRQVGTEHRWYSNGQKWLEEEYKAGQLHGQSRQWYSDGSVKFLKNFVEGKAHGEFWGWHPNGELAEHTLFHHGRASQHKAFISDGKLYRNIVFHNEQRLGLKGDAFCKSDR